MCSCFSCSSANKLSDNRQVKCSSNSLVTAAGLVDGRVMAWGGESPCPAAFPWPYAARVLLVPAPTRCPPAVSSASKCSRTDLHWSRLLSKVQVTELNGHLPGSHCSATSPAHTSREALGSWRGLRGIRPAGERGKGRAFPAKVQLMNSCRIKDTDGRSTCYNYHFSTNYVLLFFLFFIFFFLNPLGMWLLPLQFVSRTETHGDWMEMHHRV